MSKFLILIFWNKYIVIKNFIQIININKYNSIRSIQIILQFQ